MPPDLSERVRRALRRYFEGDTRVEAIVERRRDERRNGDRRGGEWPAATNGSNGSNGSNGTHRRLLNSDGRRVAERRRSTRPVDSPELPAGARRHAARLRFVKVLPPSERDLLNVEADRLVLRYQGGDASAFEELYRRFIRPSHGYARMSLQDEHGSRDVVQEVSLKALERIPKHHIDAEKRFRPWLITVSRNTITDALRARKHFPVTDPVKLAQFGAEQVDEHAELVLRFTESGNRWLSDPDVARAVARLPGAQRRVIEMKYANEMTSAEIAAELGITDSTVRRHKREAFKKIEEHLNRTGAAERLRARHMEYWTRVKPARVMSRRRFALTGGITPAGALIATAARSWQPAPYAGRRSC